MIYLTSDDFSSAFETLSQSLDYGAIRQSSEKAVITCKTEKYSQPLGQILYFSLKWKLAFNQFPIQHELECMNDSQKARLREALKHFAQQLEISEQGFYKKKFKGTVPDHAYMLSEKPDWAIRFLFIFKVGEIYIDKVTVENIYFFINLLTMLSILLEYRVR